MRKLLLLLGMLVPQILFGWGQRGHNSINRAAVRSIPEDGPVFLKAQEDWIAYLSTIPDTWRNAADPFAKMLEDPNHGWFKEQFAFMNVIPRSRYEFVLALYDEHKKLANTNPEAAKLTNVRWTGTLPYAAAECYDRMVAAMRLYRTAKQASNETKWIELQIAAEMGRLGHYTGDGAQPLHVTIHHDGWQGPNPKNYTRETRVHGRFETAYVDLLEVTPEQVVTRMDKVKRVEDAFEGMLAHLDKSFTHMEEVYILDKANAFTDKTNEHARELVYERLASGAQMLRDLTYSAWLDSAVPPTAGANPISLENPLFNPATGSAPATKRRP